MQGSVTKHGNPRLRAALVECAWRLVRFQPQYPPVRKRLHILATGAKATGAARKKAIVAVARHLAVALWRIFTGRCSAAQLGLRCPEPEAAPIPATVADSGGTGPAASAEEPAVASPSPANHHEQPSLDPMNPLERGASSQPNLGPGRAPAAIDGTAPPRKAACRHAASPFRFTRL